MADEDKTVRDGTVDFVLGQDAWHRPDLIQPNQYAKGINLSSRGGSLTSRPGFHEKTDLNFEERILVTQYGYNRTIKEIWQTGKFQAQIPYFRYPDYFLIVVISGLIFRVNTVTGSVILISEDVVVNQYKARINWSFAEESIVIFDFPDYPVIITGETAMRADPNHLIPGANPELQPQIPISELGTFNQNRLFIFNEGSDFTASDAVGNLATPDAPLTFTEVLTPSSPFYRQFFSLPTGDATSPVTAAGFIQQVDANTGIGPMFVSNSKNIFFYNTNQPREQWTNSEFGKLLIANAGIAGPRAFTNVNSDVFFLSKEGLVYTFSSARTNYQEWANTPISREVQNFLKFHDPNLSQLAVLGYFDNRIYISANPYRVQCLDRSQRPVTDYAHGGFVVLDVEKSASLLTKGTPAWDGLYTGINPMEISNLGDRCFVMSKDGVNGIGHNVLYTIEKKSTIDRVGTNKRRIKSIVYTKRYFAEEEVFEKREKYLSVYLRNLKGLIDLLVERKPTHAAEFLQWTKWKYDAAATDCRMPEEGFYNGYAPHEFKRLVFGDADVQGCNPVTDTPYLTFTALQFRLSIRGEFWSLDKFIASAERVPVLERQDNDLCETAPVVRIPLQCNPDWLIPEVDICRQ